MTIVADWRSRVIAALLVVAAVLFVIGVAAEPNNDTHSHEPSGEVAPRSETGGAGEHSEAGESAEARASEGTGNEVAESNEERVLGLHLESPGLLALAVVLSAVLAGAVLWRPDRRVLLAIALVAAGFVVLDIAEAAHQLNENRTGLAVLAATIAAMHTATAALAVWQLTARAPETQVALGANQGTPPGTR
jgi:hypothetical protein